MALIGRAMAKRFSRDKVQAILLLKIASAVHGVTWHGIIRQDRESAEFWSRVDNTRLVMLTEVYRECGLPEADLQDVITRTKANATSAAHAHASTQAA
jgi:hypothetical protein